MLTFLQNPAPFPLWPQVPANSLSQGQETFQRGSSVPNFSDTSLLPAPRFQILLLRPQPHPKAQAHLPHQAPNPKPQGGKVLSLFFVNSPLITPAIPQSVCTVIVEFDAND